MPVQTARRQLGRLLKREREQRGFTQEDVAAADVCSTTTLWRIESGATRVREGTVWSLCQLYGSDAATSSAFQQMVPGTRDGEEQDGSSAAWVAMYLDLEATCTALFSWHPLLIHAVLQTDRYARVVAGTDGASEEVMRARLRRRAERQKDILARGCAIHLIVAEAAFTQIQMGESVMTEQLDHLHACARLPQVDLQVLPATTPIHPGIRGPFSILDFEADLDPTVVYLEYLTGAQYLDRDQHVNPYRTAFSQLQGLSTPIEEIHL